MLSVYQSEKDVDSQLMMINTVENNIRNNCTLEEKVIFFEFTLKPPIWP